jgi:hypothetical protein
LYALSSFQRTDAHRAGITQSRWPSPFCTVVRGTFQGYYRELALSIPTTFLCITCVRDVSGTKKIAPVCFGATVRRCAPGLAYRRTLIVSQYTRSGWAFRPHSALGVSGYWLSRLTDTEPRARYLTRPAATYLRWSASRASTIIRDGWEAVKYPNYPSILMMRRSRCPLRSTITDWPMASAIVTSPRSSLRRRSLT